MKTREEKAEEFAKQAWDHRYAVGPGGSTVSLNDYLLRGYIAGHASRDVELAAKDLRIEKLEETLRLIQMQRENFPEDAAETIQRLVSEALSERADVQKTVVLESKKDSK